MKKKVIICNYDSYYGGTLVLSAMCKYLRELGYDASLVVSDRFTSDAEFKPKPIFYIIRYNLKLKIKRLLCRQFPRTKLFNKYRTNDQSPLNVPGVRQCWLPFSLFRDLIVIYPEVVFGNPLRSKNVARWLLSHYKYEDSPGAYGKNDVFYAFREVFNSSKLNPQEEIVRFNYFDSILYRQYNFRERSGKCYILRKGRNRKDLPQEFDGPVYDDDMNQNELVEMFNTYKYCYCYDLQTFYSTIAAVCGCIPIEVPEPGKTIADYRSEDEKEHFGIAWGDCPEQIQYAIDTRERLLDSLNFEYSNRCNAQHLVELLEKRFGKIKRL